MSAFAASHLPGSIFPTSGRSRSKREFSRVAMAALACEDIRVQRLKRFITASPDAMLPTDTEITQVPHSDPAIANDPSKLIRRTIRLQRSHLLNILQPVKAENFPEFMNLPPELRGIVTDYRYTHAEILDLDMLERAVPHISQVSQGLRNDTLARFLSRNRFKVTVSSLDHVKPTKLYEWLALWKDMRYAVPRMQPLRIKYEMTALSAIRRNWNAPRMEELCSHLVAAGFTNKNVKFFADVSYLVGDRAHHAKMRNRVRQMCIERLEMKLDYAVGDLEETKLRRRLQERQRRQREKFAAM